jgi:Asp-tRNA(Asn)/Glu-tRNA(Gln) amidotransferase B subunit
MPKDIVEEQGWTRIGDENSLKALCEKLIARNLDKVTK